MNNQLPYNFSTRVMESIEKEILRREKREEVITFSIIIAAGVILVATALVLAYMNNWFQKVIDIFTLETTFELNPIWIITIINAIILAGIYNYFIHKKERAATLPPL